MSKREDFNLSVQNIHCEKPISPFSNSGSYTPSDSNYLVNAESSKQDSEKPLMRMDYPFYQKDHAQEINELIYCVSTKVTEVVNTDRIHTVSWSLSECYSLITCVYDPRNYGRVVPKFPQEIEAKPDYFKKNIKKEDKGKKFKKVAHLSI